MSLRFLPILEKDRGETPISKAIAKTATNKMDIKIKIVMCHVLPVMVL